MIVPRWLEPGEYAAELFAGLQRQDPEILAEVTAPVGEAVLGRWKIVGLFSDATCELVGAFFFDQFDLSHLFIFEAWRRRWQMLLTMADVLDFVFETREHLTTSVPETTTVVVKLARALGGRCIRSEDGAMTFTLLRKQWRESTVRAHIAEYRHAHHRLDARAGLPGA